MTDQQSKAIGTIELSAQVDPSGLPPRGSAERVNSLCSLATASVDQISKIILEMTQSSCPRLGGERFITDSELSALLKISRRTLQQWRTDGVLPYIQMVGKIIYKESDINAMIENNYIKSYRFEE